MQPDPATVQLVQRWLVKARRDLLSADRLSPDPELSDNVAFHCQQGAEKALKGYLVWAGVPFVKTHSLEDLLGQCVAVEPAFSTLELAARFLSKYAVAARYPEMADPAEAEARNAARLARSVYDFVERQIPPSAWP